MLGIAGGSKKRVTEPTKIGCSITSCLHTQLAALTNPHLEVRFNSPHEVNWQVLPFESWLASSIQILCHGHETQLRLFSWVLTKSDQLSCLLACGLIKAKITGAINYSFPYEPTSGLSSLPKRNAATCPLFFPLYSTLIAGNLDVQIWARSPV